MNGEFLTPPLGLSAGEPGERTTEAREAEGERAAVQETAERTSQPWRLSILPQEM